MAIFISYSHQDKKFVDSLCRNLVVKKIHVWLDRWELRPGDSLIDSIQTALQHAGAVLMILSKSYVESSWCKKEMNSSLIRELEEKGNLVIPVIIEECEIPLFLREKMYADFRSDWDEAFRILSEALSKYTNLDQGRVDTPEFHIDYSSEYLTCEDSVVGLRYQFVEHAENRPFTILTILHISFEEKWQKRYQQYLDAGYEDFGRAVFTSCLIEYLEAEEIKVALADAKPIRRKIVFCDKSGMSSLLDLEIRWMGDDTGKTVIHWTGDTIKGALKQFISKVRKLSPSEMKELHKVISSPIE